MWIKEYQFDREILVENLRMWIKEYYFEREILVESQAIYWQQYPWALGEVTCKARSLISEMTGMLVAVIILKY